MSKSARPYQSRAIEECCRHLAAGKNTLLVSPTGSGKTYMSGSIARRLIGNGSKALILAHRRELVHQLSNTLSEFGVAHGVIAPGMPPMKHFGVQVSSIQAILSSSRSIGRDKLDLIVIDEAHRAAADSYQYICKKHPKTPVLGLTATPWRTDGKPLSVAFDELVVATSIENCVEAGYLVEPWVIQPEEYDWDKGQMVGDPVSKWAKYARGMRTILFASSVEESMRYADEFNKFGIKAVHICSKTKDERRRSVLSGIEGASPDPMVICNYDLLTEGVDIPSLQCVILARKTESSIVYRQAVGRIMRPPGPAIVLDLASITMHHGFVTDEPDYSLDGRMPKIDGEARDDIRICDGCKSVLPAKGACRECGPDKGDGDGDKQKEPLSWIDAELVDLSMFGNKVSCGKCGSRKVSIKEGKISPGKQDYYAQCAECSHLGKFSVKSDKYEKKTQASKRLYWDKFVDQARSNTSDVAKVRSFAKGRFRKMFGEWPPWSWGESVK